ncbi:MAG: hypothetical protein H6747_07350 [Deltaproteobacteria bacterium]|nr:hypothetical protein [Deltaproteobacteria bacterium]
MSLRSLTTALGTLLVLAVASPAAALSGIAIRALCEGDGGVKGDNAPVAKAARAEGDAAFARRADAKQVDLAIAAYERSLAANAAQPEVRVKLSRAYYLIGDGRYRFAEEDEAQLEAFEKGMRHAAAALATVNPAFRSRICSGAPLGDAMAVLDRASVPALYWFATHLGKYGLAKDLLEVLANKDMIFQSMARLRELAPDYFYYAPDRYLGAYYTKVPFPAGDLPRSLAHFQASMRGARDYFATYVLTAELYALKAKAKTPESAKFCRADSATGAAAGAENACRRLFRVMLEHVVKAENKLPDIAAEQEVERQKAKRLLEELDTYFPSAN